MDGDILKKRKIAVLGSRSVGKSSLVIQFVEDRFVESYYPTIENSFTKSITHKNFEYDCEIIDTAGQDEYSILNSNHAIGIHGYVLVYSITSRKSFEMIHIIYEKIVDFCGTQSIPCVVVGAKSDLEHRQVSATEGETLANEIGASWVETSAKLNTNVGKVFDLCLSEIEKRSPRYQTQPENSKCFIM